MKLTRSELDAAWSAAIEAKDDEALMRLMVDDFEGFCMHFVWIKNRRNKPIRFDRFNRCQRVALWYIRRQQDAGLPIRQVWLKCRQVGFSTLAAIFIGYRAAIHGENGLIALHEEGPGKRVFDKVETMYAKLPAGILPPTTETEKGSLRVFDQPLESVIRRDSAEKIEIGVGETFQNIALSDAARFKDLAASKADLIPTIPDEPDTAIIEESTAKGAGDAFHQDYVAAENGESEYLAGFFPWYWHTEEYVRDLDDLDPPFSEEDEAYRSWVAKVGVPYPLDDTTWEPLDPPPAPGFVLSDAQLNWRRFKLRSYKGDVDRFREQYPATADEAFVAGSGLVVSSTVADRVAEGVVKPSVVGEWVTRIEDGKKRGVLEHRRDGRYWQWDAPTLDRFYIISADTSSGAAEDSSAAVVWDVNGRPGKMVQAAEWVGKLAPHEFAKLLYRLGMAYRQEIVRGGKVRKVPALIAVERNFHGASVISSLLRFGYPATRIYKHYQEGTERAKDTDKYGWPTSWASKIPMVEGFAAALFDADVDVRSSRLLKEIRSFVWMDGHEKAGAIAGAHDDVFMASAVGVGVWRRQPKPALGVGVRRQAAAESPLSAHREAGAGIQHVQGSVRRFSGGGLVSDVTGC